MVCGSGATGIPTINGTKSVHRSSILVTSVDRKKEEYSQKCDMGSKQPFLYLSPHSPARYKQLLVPRPYK